MALSHINNVALSGLSAINGQTLSGLSEILGQTIGAGGGPVEYFAAVLQEGGAINPGDSPWESGSFSPTAGRRLVALMTGTDNGPAIDVAANGSISDSQSMTWTPIAGLNHATAAYGMRVFISSVVPASTSTTVTLDCGADSIGRYRIAIFEVTGTDGTVQGLITNNAAATDGADSLTLTATPTVDDLVVYMRVRNATGGYVIGSGFVEVVDADLTNQGVGIAVNDNTTSTSISITDARDGGSSSSENIHMAFIIKAG